MIHSPPLSMNRVSVKFEMAQRMAAHEEGAVSPTPVTMPDDRMATGCMSHFLSRPFAHLGRNQLTQRPIIGLAELSGAVPALRHDAGHHLHDIEDVPLQRQR